MHHKMSLKNEGLISNGRVLLADDNATITRLVSYALRSWEHEVHVVRDGKAALDEIMRWYPDCAILDVAMPIMSGFEVAAQVRRHESMNSIRLVAMTAHAYNVIAARADRAGFNHLLFKPFTLDALRMALERGIDSRGIPKRPMPEDKT